MNKTWAELQRNLSRCELYKQQGEKVCTNCDNIDCGSNSNAEIKDKKLEEIWRGLEDIPVDDNNKLCKNYFAWKKGDDIHEDVWRWFDARHSKGVAWLVCGLFE